MCYKVIGVLIVSFFFVCFQESRLQRVKHFYAIEAVNTNKEISYSWQLHIKP